MSSYVTRHSSLVIWKVVDSGPLPGAKNMAIDRDALAAMMNGENEMPTLRFFQWDKPTVTYGYLLDPEKVKEWAAKIENGKLKMEAVKRPTGGGAVLHGASDLSLSLLWPRSSKLFSDAPRACYAEIHDVLMLALERQNRRPGESRGPGFKLFSKDKLKDWIPASAGMTNTCAAPNRFSACFQEPVCNDVMLNGKKIVGGALRITKQAILYQGTIQIPGIFDFELVKKSFVKFVNQYGS